MLAEAQEVDRLWTMPEVAEFLRVSVRTVKRMTHRGELPFFRVGAQLRYVPSEVKDWLRTQRSPGGEE